MDQEHQRFQDAILRGVKEVLETESNDRKLEVRNVDIPHPRNPLTTLLYDLPQDSRVRLVVFDILGREVETLMDEQKPAGYYSLTWDGRDDRGNPLSSGMYITRMEAKGTQGQPYSKVRKMLLLK